MEKSLQVVERKEVAFYDDQVVAIRVKDGTVYVPVKPLCEMLGVSWSGQRRRINRDAVLAEEVRSVNLTFTEPDRTRQISMLCLPLDLISGFLFGITPARVKEEIREKLIRDQRECYRILSEAFYEGRVTAEPTFSELLNTADPDIVQAY